MNWVERISKMSREEIKALQANAQRLGATEVLDLCKTALTPARSGNPKHVGVHNRGRPVIGFHFVCPTETAVTKNLDGTVWTGTWVVDQKHAERGARIGAYVALHTTKSQPSYLQGTIKDWRKAERESHYAEDTPARIRYGIDFLLEPTDSPFEWQGDGAGEKGYAYSSENRDEHVLVRNVFA